MYFAAKEPKEVSAVLLGKANDWYQGLYTNGYFYKVRDMWLAYHGAYFSDTANGHQISFSGEQGELVNLAVNHIRNIAEHMLTMITSNRPAMAARATNTDYKSMAQTKLASELLDYYMREKRMEKYLKEAVRYAIILGTGYIKMDWNATTGEQYDFNEELNVPIYEGDVEFCNLSPFDVFFDSYKNSSDHDWIVCRSFKNKYDIIAKYPEYEDKIKGLKTKSDYYNFRFDQVNYDTTDDVPVYEFFHKRTEAMPDGRYMLFLDGEITLLDQPLPYRNIPVYRISPSDILGTAYGYTPLFDLLPIQEAVNSLYSTILTNNHTFGVQSVFVPRQGEINIKSLEGGMTMIEGNAGFKPEPINFTQTPPETFNFLKMLESQMETISGVNSVARGNPEASLKSGAALALVQSMSLQFMSGLQQSYVQMIEDVGIGLIKMLQDFAEVPRIAMIAGKDNRVYVKKEFSGQDLDQVNRIIVDVGNPLAQSTAGKIQLAESLIQYGIVKTPEQYFSVLNTGRLDAMTDDTQRELMLIKDENERMAAGEEVQALAIDQHVLHIKNHRTVLSDTELRRDPTLVQSVLAHVQQHIELLQSVDPSLLSIIGEQSLQQANPPQAPMPPPDMNQSAQGQVESPLGPPPGPGDLPGMPNLPKVDPGVLPNPQIQDQSMGNLKQ